AAATEVYPSRFMLVCAMNPCKCGWYGHPSGRCKCDPRAVEKYTAKLSGPLLDRIDLFIEVPALEFEELSQRPEKTETSAEIRLRVNAARALQAERFGTDGPDCNAHMEQRELADFCQLDEDSQALMKGAFEKMGLTARSYDRILRVSRTIADMEGSPRIELTHLAEALQYRSTTYLRR
ncbi:MAG: ATP-binding protein, partial [Oscillospiraceae bacterium]